MVPIASADWLESYQTLALPCPSCGHVGQFTVPVNLQNLCCPHCGQQADPIQCYPEGPVNHLLMQRLIATCYKHPDFAQEVISLYRRDFDHAKSEDWCVDKRLLLVHAANAVVQRGHRSWMPFALLILLLAVGLMIENRAVATWLITVVALPVFILSFSANKNRVFLHRYLEADAYDPTQIPRENSLAIGKLLHFTEWAKPINVLFFSGFEPFQQTGYRDSSWSILIDRRKMTGGTMREEPVELDLRQVYGQIATNMQRLAGNNAHPGRFFVDDVAIVCGQFVAPDDSRFLDGSHTGKRPRYSLSPAELGRLAGADDDTFRLFKRITLYNPRRDIGITSFIHLQHRGPFTIIESIGTRILPLTAKLLGKYHDRQTPEELDQIKHGWWRDLDDRRRVIAVAVMSVITLAIGVVASSYLDPEIGNVLAPLLQVGVVLLGVLGGFGFRPKLEDEFEPRRDENWVMFLLRALGGDLSNGEKERRCHRDHIEHLKQCREFNFAPTKWGLRYWQSRAWARNYLEDRDLNIWRMTQDRAVQEAFLNALEAAGIDTSEFREGLAQINNYGIINSGQIGGDAKAEQPRMRKKQDGTAQAGQNKAVQ